MSKLNLKDIFMSEAKDYWGHIQGKYGDWRINSKFAFDLTDTNHPAQISEDLEKFIEAYFGVSWTQEIGNLLKQLSDALYEQLEQGEKENEEY